MRKSRRRRAIPRRTVKSARRGGREGTRSCAGGGCAAPEGAAHDAMGVGFLDTIELDALQGEPADEPIVRPSLAILFRMAVGPAADYYAPRFLEYERIGRSFPSWNWAAPWVPTVWAFYHKLWAAGLAFALWPVAAMEIFGLVDPYLGDSTFVSFACAL